MSRNPLEREPERAWSEILRQRFPDWNEGERVTGDDALDVSRRKVCRECGKRLGHKHVRNCPQREG